jgi:hypothetical protein
LVLVLYTREMGSDGDSVHEKRALRMMWAVCGNKSTTLTLQPRAEGVRVPPIQKGTWGLCGADWVGQREKRAMSSMWAVCGNKSTPHAAVSWKGSPVMRLLSRRHRSRRLPAAWAGSHAT